MTRAMFLLSITPGTRPPDAQIMPAATSDVRPPFQLKALIGKIRAAGAIPEKPTPSFGWAAMIPATWVPCQLLERMGAWPRQSPGSVGFLSHPVRPYFVVST